jgi:hypothetical protein
VCSSDLDTPYYTVAAASLYWHKQFAYIDGSAVYPPAPVFEGITAEELARLKDCPPIPTIDREPLYPALMAASFRLFGFEYSSVTRLNAVFLFPLNRGMWRFRLGSAPGGAQR